jgi:hypothetical protein
MSSANYRPWHREQSQSQPSLAAEGHDAWRELLDESRRSIADLRNLSGQVQKRMQTGARLLVAMRQTQEHDPDATTTARLRAIENRLARLEAAVDRLAAAPVMPTMPRLADAA